MPNGGISMSTRQTRITLLTLCAMFLALGFPANAQQPKKIAKIAYLAPSTPAVAAHLVEAFRQGLRELGYVEGKTFVLELRHGEARAERLPELARELVGLKVDVIVDGYRCSDCRGQTRDADDPDCYGKQQRSGGDRVRCEPRASRRKCHRTQQYVSGS